MKYKFRNAWAAAFVAAQDFLVWTNDQVLVTSAIESWIYSGIAKELDLILIAELYKVDALFFSRDAVASHISTRRGYPMPETSSIMIEHEMNFALSHEEMDKLANSSASLNVLVTYIDKPLVEQIFAANTKFRSALEASPRLQKSLLIVLPCQESEGVANQNQIGRCWTPHAGWWNFLVWCPLSNSFKLLD